jgi:4-hydroxy-3-methylbut-2-enyl diphosphate reductase
MEVIKITPRGYCHGVVQAIQKAKNAAKDPSYPRPIHILGLIVHNQHVVDELKNLGVITLEGDDRLTLLDSIEKGTVIFTAHGVSPAVRQKALAKGLTCLDATCPDVTKTHLLVRKLSSQGYHIIYIGKKNHPETLGVIGECPDRVILVEGPEDVQALSLTGDKLALTTQTTLSKWDTQKLIEAIKHKYPAIEVYNEICRATQQRQEAAVEAGKSVDLVLVVGDRRSNNSSHLAYVVEKMTGCPAYLVERIDEINPSWLRGVEKVGVTAGSSTPTALTQEVIAYLQSYSAQVTTDKQP